MNEEKEIIERFIEAKEITAGADHVLEMYGVEGYLKWLEQRKKEYYAKKEEEMATKTKAELQQEIEELQEKVNKLDRFEKYVDAADEMAAIVEAYENSGFSREEAMQMTIATINAATKIARPSLF